MWFFFTGKGLSRIWWIQSTFKKWSLMGRDEGSRKGRPSEFCLELPEELRHLREVVDREAAPCLHFRLESWMDWRKPRECLIWPKTLMVYRKHSNRVDPGPWPQENQVTVAEIPRFVAAARHLTTSSHSYLVSLVKWTPCLPVLRFLLC